MTRTRAVGALLLAALLVAFVLLRDSPESTPEASRPAESVNRPASASPSIAERTQIEPAGEGASPGMIAAQAESASRTPNALPGTPNALPGTPANLVPRGPAATAPSGSRAAPPTRPRPGGGAAPPALRPPTEDDVVERFRDTYGDPDPEHERQMIDARRERSLQVVEGLMAGLAEQEEAARRAGDTERAAQLARSLRRLEWRHQVLDREPSVASEPTEALGTTP